MAFAELLAESRVARGLSQEELAAAAAVSVRAISDLERSVTRRPQQVTVRALAVGLGLAGEARAAFEAAARAAPLPRPRRAGPRVTLPAPVTSIVGRDADLAGVLRLVRGRAARLVTVTGPGGVGKSRLAAEVGWRTGTGFDRVDGVDLSPLASAEDVPGAVAAGLGLRPGPGDPVAALAAVIGADRRLLVLDSFEHVITAAPQLAALLGACPLLTVLVTSRSPVALRGEYLWPMEPLPVPPPGATADPAELRGNPAVALLVERAGAVRPGFALDAANAGAVAQLCRAADGLPLAIELAAVHLRTLDPAELHTQLAPHYAGLGAPTVDRPDRHATLRATVEWSTDRLPAEHRLLLGALAVFAGGAAPAAVRTVLAAAGAAHGDLDGAVAVLAATSLVGVADHGGQPRVLMLDTIREVAAELLAASGHGPAVRRAHARYFLDLVRAGTEPDRIEAEWDNVRAGLGWTLAEEPNAPDLALVGALAGHLTGRSRFAEAHRLLTAVAEPAGAEPAVRARALHAAGIAADQAGDHRRAVELADRAAALCTELDDPAGHAAALTLAGNAYKALGEHDRAETAHRACLDTARTAGDRRREAIALNNLGTLAHDRGDLAGARRYYEASLAAKEELGDDRGVAVGLLNLGGLANDAGEHAAARDRLRRAAEYWRAAEERHSLSFALGMLAEAELGAGDPAAARVAAEDALRLARQIEYPAGVGLALSRLGDLAAAAGDPVGAADRYAEALEFTSDARETARTVERLTAARSLIAGAADAG